MSVDVRLEVWPWSIVLRSVEAVGLLNAEFTVTVIVLEVVVDGESALSVTWSSKFQGPVAVLPSV
jgi:hypothetical protein